MCCPAVETKQTGSYVSKYVLNLDVSSQVCVLFISWLSLETGYSRHHLLCFGTQIHHLHRHSDHRRCPAPCTLRLDLHKSKKAKSKENIAHH